MMCIHLFGAGLGAASVVPSCSGIRFSLDLLCMSGFPLSAISLRCVFGALKVSFTLLNCALYTLSLHFHAAHTEPHTDSSSLTGQCWSWCLDVIISIVSYSLCDNEVLLSNCWVPNKTATHTWHGAPYLARKSEANPINKAAIFDSIFGGLFRPERMTFFYKQSSDNTGFYWHFTGYEQHPQFDTSDYAGRNVQS